MSERVDRGWWQHTQRFFDEAPQAVAVARDHHDNLVGFQVSVTPNNAPAFADEDPLLGPWLEHARRHSPDGNAIIWHDSIDLTGKPHLRVQAMLGMAGILRSGLDNPRYAYMPISPAMAAALQFARALGAKHVPELDVNVGGHRLECHSSTTAPAACSGSSATGSTRSSASSRRRSSTRPPTPTTPRRSATPCATSACRTSSRRTRSPTEPRPTSAPSPCAR